MTNNRVGTGTESGIAQPDNMQGTHNVTTGRWERGIGSYSVKNGKKNTARSGT